MSAHHQHMTYIDHLQDHLPSPNTASPANVIYLHTASHPTGNHVCLVIPSLKSNHRRVRERAKVRAKLMFMISEKFSKHMLYTQPMVIDTISLIFLIKIEKTLPIN
jgi:predicted thioesterase